MATREPLRIFIGWDSQQMDAYEVARHSVIRHSSIPLDVRPIRLGDLHGLYKRRGDPLASTEFTYTRFLTPALAGYRGWALYFDCDFLWLGDVAGIMHNVAATVNGTQAVYCVKHDHKPKEALKGNGKAQTTYPRKNWSSLMLFNCDHPSTRLLTPEVVEQESAPYLHRMLWADDKEIGALPEDYNWLEGYSKFKHDDWNPKAVHFTDGGPWLEHRRHITFGHRWRQELELVRQGRFC